MEQNTYNDGGMAGSSCGIIDCNKGKNKSPFTYFLYAALGIFCILAAIIIGDAALSTNKVHSGVTVVGIDSAGKDRRELMSSLSKLEAKLRGNDIQLVREEKSWDIDPVEFDLRIDKNATIDKALAFGRSGSSTNRVKTRIKLWFKPVSVKPIVTSNKNKMDALLAKIGKTVEKIPEDAAIKIVDGRAVSTKSRNGLAIDRKVLSSLIENSALQGKTEITLPVLVVTPDITEANLEATLIEVKQMVKEPIVLKYRADSWELSTDELTSWIEFEKVRQEDRWDLNAKFDKERLVSFIEQSTKKITTEPKDAEFKIEKDVVTIVPGSDGTKVDLDKVYEDITNVCEFDEVREVMLETSTSQPKLTTADAENMGIKEKVSGFSTTFNARQYARVHNIKTLSAALDGSMLAPGQEFSFNGAIGPRTAAKGYKEAPAILNGELVPSLGGGVCQVATTLFNTIFFGGYEVVERHNHSFFISHYPTGRDATVSWGGPDLKFKNDSDSYLLIKTITTNGSITINFYGTKRNLKVDYTTAGPSNYRPSTIQKVDDPSLPKGVKKIVDKGFSGRDVTVYRTVTIDGAVYKKNTFVSKYAPKKTVMRVGTGVTADKATPKPDDDTANGNTEKPADNTTNTQTTVAPSQDIPDTQQ